MSLNRIHQGTPSRSKGGRRWGVIGWFVILLIAATLLISRCSSEKKVEVPIKNNEVQTKAEEVRGEPAPPSQEPAPSTGGIAPEVASKNKLPEVVSVKLVPWLVYPGTRVKAEVEGKDEDGDTVSYYYEWKRNDDLLAGEILGEIDTKGFKKRDFITVSIIPYDGKEKGKPKNSRPIVVANSPPEIASIPSSVLSNGKYLYEVKATDPDGDKLTYSLEGAPPGMTIDAATGLVQWDVPQGDKAKPGARFNLKIVVSDGDAKAFQGFEFSLTK